MTDENVLATLMRARRATRAEIAATTGISKPTISESMRRLTEAGLVVDTGQRTTTRGGVGSYYTLADDVGVAFVLTIAPTGVSGEVVDAFGTVVARANAPLDRSAGQTRAAQALVEVASMLATEVAKPVRAAVVSAADPVDRRTGTLVHLPDAPFLVGELAPVELLQPLVNGTITVDNDVNWAARAESESGCAQGVGDFVYLHLGEGLGCAVVSDGEVRRGHHGVAGEIAYLHTVGPDGLAMPLIEVFAVLGLRHPFSTAIDVDALRAKAKSDWVVRATVVRAVAVTLTAAVSLVDPQMAVIGGEWGPDLAESIHDQLAATSRPLPVRTARITDPSTAGARTHAIERLRSAIIQTTSVKP